MSVLDRRREFVGLAAEEGVNFRALCARFGVSAKTGYKWLARHRAGGRAGVADRSHAALAGVVSDYSHGGMLRQLSVHPTDDRIVVIPGMYVAVSRNGGSSWSVAGAFWYATTPQNLKLRAREELHLDQHLFFYARIASSQPRH